MHSPEPYGLFSNDEDISSKDAAFIKSSFAKMNNFMAASKLSDYAIVKALPDGGSVRLINMGGVRKAVVSKPKYEAQEFERSNKISIPMFLSGNIKSPRIGFFEAPEVTLTEQSRLRLGGYKGSKPSKNLRLFKYKIEHSSKFSGFRLDLSDDYKYTTQYTYLKPTCYSGSMCAAIQLISGYGIRSESLIRAKARGATIDEHDFVMDMVLPIKVAMLVEEELERNRHTVYMPFNGEPRHDGEIIYDFRFENTDLISFDTDANPWLVNVSPRGVYVMPLPLVRATTTNAFKDYVKELKDNEILEVLNKFKGLPTGETFPTSQDEFDAWVRAGIITKVCDTADFYDHAAYEVFMGWSISENGKEGVNTCYEPNDKGYAYGHTYKLELNLAPIKKVKNKYSGLSKAEMQQISIYLANLKSELDEDNLKDRAILSKLYQVDAATIKARAQSFGNSLANELAYWNDMDLSLEAKHQGRVERIQSGDIVRNALAEFFWSIPYIPDDSNWDGLYPKSNHGLISFDFSQFTGQGLGSSVLDIICNTVVMGYYIGNELHTLRYFSRYIPAEVTGTGNAAGGGEFTSNAKIYNNVGMVSDFYDGRAFTDLYQNRSISNSHFGYEPHEFVGIDGTAYHNVVNSLNSIENNKIIQSMIVPYGTRNAVEVVTNNISNSTNETSNRTFFGTAKLDPEITLISGITLVRSSSQESQLLSILLESKTKIIDKLITRSSTFLRTIINSIADKSDEEIRDLDYIHNKFPLEPKDEVIKTALQKYATKNSFGTTEFIAQTGNLAQEILGLYGEHVILGNGKPKIYTHGQTNVSDGQEIPSFIGVINE